MSQQAPAAGDAVLQMAIQMEDLGRDFYDALAVATDDRQLASLCRNLSAAEAQHRHVFLRMHAEMARLGRSVLLSDEQLARVRKASKETILPSPEEIRQAARAGGAARLLGLAIQMEKDSIGFYSDIAASLSKDPVVEAIIREEQGHLRELMAAR